MSGSAPRLPAWLALICLLPLGWAQAGTYTWNRPSTVTDNWFTATNWLPAGAPTNASDSAVITNGLVLLASNTAALADFTLTNATLIFSNWDTCLLVTNVTIWNRGTVTVANAFTTNQMSNRVWIVCSNFALNAGGTIFADARGFASSNGPGRGTSYGGTSSGNDAGGGGYGGQGGSGYYLGGNPYGSVNEPFAPGSGGGAMFNAGAPRSGGHGGGAIRIEASGSVTINGTVSANGGPGDGAGYAASAGGSGGAIYIACLSFAATNGILRADGGLGVVRAGTYSGGGGGGRIAVNYTNLVGAPSLQISANSAAGRHLRDFNAPLDCPAAQVGTLWFPTPALLDGILVAGAGVGSGLNGYAYFGSTNAWAPGGVVLSNSTLGIPADYRWQVTNDLTVVTGGVLVAADASLACEGNLTLTNGASLMVYSRITNGTTTNYGNLVGVTNTLTVAANCWIYPFAHSTNGGAVLFRVGNLAIQAGGGINADGRGYAVTNGPGKGIGRYDTSGEPGGSGGGYGGRGGTGVSTAGVVYGSANAPLLPGSGAGDANGSRSVDMGCHGGGLVWIEAGGSVTVDGTVSA